jgi:hypothetical protein
VLPGEVFEVRWGPQGVEGTPPGVRGFIDRDPSTGIRGPGGSESLGEGGRVVPRLYCQREIARRTGIHHAVVRRYIRRRAPLHLLDVSDLP